MQRDSYIAWGNIIVLEDAALLEVPFDRGAMYMVSTEEARVVRGIGSWHTCIISLRRTVSKGYEQIPATAVTVCATPHLAMMLAFFSSLKSTPLAVS